LEKEDRRFALTRDLFLSPMHAVAINDRFFEAHQLLFTESVDVKEDKIVYYNFELEGCNDPFKYTLCAEGLTVESLGERGSISREGFVYENPKYQYHSSCL
jgi:hypothetical protein